MLQKLGKCAIKPELGNAAEVFVLLFPFGFEALRRLSWLSVQIGRFTYFFSPMMSSPDYSRWGWKENSMPRDLKKKTKQFRQTQVLQKRT